MLRWTTPPPSDATGRRRRKIERQLRALRVMQAHMSTKDIVLAVLTVPGVALLCLLIAAKLHWLSKSMPLAVVGALVAGLAAWWIGRRWVTIAWLIVIALICILLEDIPSFDLGDSGKKQAKEKMGRREKLERAIARREALLRSMDRAEPR
jgi:hypothetical protein